MRIFKTCCLLCVVVSELVHRFLSNFQRNFVERHQASFAKLAQIFQTYLTSSKSSMRMLLQTHFSEHCIQELFSDTYFSISPNNAAHLRKCLPKIGTPYFLEMVSTMAEPFGMFPPLPESVIFSGDGRDFDRHPSCCLSFVYEENRLSRSSLVFRISAIFSSVV